MMRLAALLVAGSLALAAPAGAEVYDVSYTGAGNFGGAGFAMARGSGRFTIPGDPAQATLDGISAFSFTLQMPGADPVAYGLADLSRFQAVTSGGVLIALLPPTGVALWSETLEDIGGTADDFSSAGSTLTDTQIQGYGTVIPEPAALAVLGVGLAGLAWRRRAKARRKDAGADGAAGNLG